MSSIYLEWTIWEKKYSAQRIKNVVNTYDNNDNLNFIKKLPIT